MIFLNVFLFFILNKNSFFNFFRKKFFFSKTFFCFLYFSIFFQFFLKMFLCCMHDKYVIKSSLNWSILIPGWFSYLVLFLLINKSMCMKSVENWGKIKAFKKQFFVSSKSRVAAFLSVFKKMQFCKMIWNFFRISLQVLDFGRSRRKNIKDPDFQVGIFHPRPLKPLKAATNAAPKHGSPGRILSVSGVVVCRCAGHKFRMENGGDLNNSIPPHSCMYSIHDSTGASRHAFKTGWRGKTGIPAARWRAITYAVHKNVYQMYTQNASATWNQSAPHECIDSISFDESILFFPAFIQL